jgi:circadian clock protein KaiC
LDEILSGGIPRGNSVIVEGAPGTGKTTLAIEFLVQGAIQYQEPGIYFSFEEHPEQIYRDMLPYGLDLRSLEKQGLLRIVSISSEIYRDQFQASDGLIQQLVEGIGCKRVVLDSISLFRCGQDEERHRHFINKIGNHLRKYNVTSLLIHELDEHVSNTPFEHFVLDGVIRMSMQEHLERYRLHTIEVTKMRGAKVLHGEHIYRFGVAGIHVIPSYATVSNPTTDQGCVTTGIPSLDTVLSGGLANGGIYLLDSSSHSNTVTLILSIITERFRAENAVLILPSGTYSLNDLNEMFRQWGVNFEQLIAQHRLYFIKQYPNESPASLQNGIFDVSEISNDDYFSVLRNVVAPPMKESRQQGTHSFVYCDLNAFIGKRGEQWVGEIYPAIISLLKQLRATVLVVCNTQEISEKTKNLMERTSSGIIKVWSNGPYQFLHIRKSSDGKTSPPLVMERTDASPYVRLS